MLLNYFSFSQLSPQIIANLFLGVRPGHRQFGGRAHVRLSAARGEGTDDVQGQPLPPRQPPRHTGIQYTS